MTIVLSDPNWPPKIYKVSSIWHPGSSIQDPATSIG
ncbi:hypothetical protein NIASO_10180 [Niabella soli DSM 19437]|uniref:Uncharacterized protein n=1 Tax=Niabella soli DSM 19437 TaxID=929713 RepID=W0F3F6_9BACT|nr:hypothetical protein NIASO_10180 [Niabella soli DSM 19437]